MTEVHGVDLRWTFEQLDPDSAHASDIWRELAQANGASPVTMPDFVFACAKTLAPGPLRFAVCTRGDRVVADSTPNSQAVARRAWGCIARRSGG